MERVVDHTQGREAKTRRAGRRFSAGISLIELLVVISIIALLVGITLPVFGSVHRKMCLTKCMFYTSKIIGAEILIAQDSDGWFNPTFNFIKSVRTDFYYPNVLVNVDEVVDDDPELERKNQAEYFYDYLEDPKYLHCPESPSPFPELRKAWDEGDDWEPLFSNWEINWLMGTKCFWRNYRGISDDHEEVWGPRSLSNNPRSGKCLVSCLVNYGRGDQDRLMSSGQFIGAYNWNPTLGVNPNQFWPDFWAKDNIALSGLDAAMDCVQIQAGYVDGHVESQKGSETMGIWVESDPFVPGGGPSLRGKYYLPSGGLR